MLYGTKTTIMLVNMYENSKKKQKKQQQTNNPALSHLETFVINMLDTIIVKIVSDFHYELW